MVPANALGSALATLINRVIPDLVIVILYAVVLTGVFAFNIGKFIAVFKKETGAGIKAEQPQNNAGSTL